MSLSRWHVGVLLAVALVVATSGLVYELLAGTLASYYIGSGVIGFSTTIGVYLFALGIGSWLSRRIADPVAPRFIAVEWTVALLGGAMAPAVELAFAWAEHAAVLLYVLLFVVGMLVGLEIPLLMRLLKHDLRFEDVVARVLAFDYLGALVGALAFALLLVPWLGTTRTSLALGLLNAVAGFAALAVLRAQLGPRATRRLGAQGLLVAAVLVAGLFGAARITRWAEAGTYAGVILWNERSAYQQITVTAAEGGVQLFLNGQLQVHSGDEYRYHEALVHPALALAHRRARALVLGGGDGLAVRELLRDPAIREVVLVELDPAVTSLARRLPALRELNGGALDDPRVRIVHDDAMVWLEARSSAAAPFDVVIADFPDPNDFATGKLYTTRFYRLVRRAMHDRSVLVVQATSPLHARRSFWCIERTIRDVGLHTRPYHVHVPSFGAWGFVLATPWPAPQPERLRVGGLRYLDEATLRAAFVFPPDMGPVPVEPNRLHDQMLVHYYAAEWGGG
ncbi:MAG: polyamine aminopropyltransferase [Myxococcota bacterium]|nr:polyamine aminopropyltransferase [Myxococcota bacterium]MDW8363883.1 polyamine aminopropyltransferase [Myxococcales bacterium]